MVKDSETKRLQVEEEKSNSEGELLHLVFGICLCPLDFTNLFLLLFAVCLISKQRPNADKKRKVSHRSHLSSVPLRLG